MPEFMNPFAGVAPGRKLTDRELSRSLRLALAAEEEAVHLYEALADATDHALAQAVLQEIANEERVHAGEFLRLLELVRDDEAARLKEGAGEVEDLRGRLAAAVPVGGATGGDPPTVGNLREGEDI